MFELIRKMDAGGMIALFVFVLLAGGAIYAALHYGWFKSPWELALFIAVMCAAVILALDTQRARDATIAHSQFATRADIDLYGIESDLSKPESDDQGIYLGSFEDTEKKWAKAELRYKGAKHLLCFGPSGSGKSNSLMLPNLQNLRRSIIVTDPKGEAAAVSYKHRDAMGKCIVLNPYGVLTDGRPHLHSAGWNPLLQLDPASLDFEADAMCIADALVEASPDTGGNSGFFERSAKNLVQALVMWERIDNPDAPSLRNIPKLLNAPDAYAMVNGNRELVGGFLFTLHRMATCGNFVVENTANGLLQRLGDKNSKAESVRDVIDTLKSHFAFINDASIAFDMQKGAAIDFATLHRTITTVYLILPPDKLADQAKWLRMFVSLALQKLYQGAPNDKNPPTLPRVLFMLDEFGNLGRLEQIVKALNLVRSYRIQLWMFLQNYGQLTKSYEAECSDFLSNAGATTTFKTGGLDTATAKHLSDAFGQKETMVQTLSHSGGSVAPQAIPLIRPEQIARLPPDMTINIIEPCPWPVLAATPVYPKTRFKEGLENNPTYFG